MEFRRCRVAAQRAVTDAGPHRRERDFCGQASSRLGYGTSGGSPVIAAVFGPNRGTPIAIGVIAFFAVVAVLLLWLGFRAIASGIFAGPDGIAVRRVLLRRVWLPWSDVTGFDLIRARRLDNGFTRQSVAIAVLRPDGHRPLCCLGASFARPQPAADQMLTALCADRAEASRSQAIIHGTAEFGLP